MQINEVGTLKTEWQAMLIMKNAYLLLKDHQPLSFIASETNSFFLESQTSRYLQEIFKFSMLTMNSISFKYPRQVKQHLTSSSSQTFCKLCCVTSIRFSKGCELQRRVRTPTLELQWTINISQPRENCSNSEDLLRWCGALHPEGHQGDGGNRWEGKYNLLALIQSFPLQTSEPSQTSF